jgi:aryl-alcohol dehydrogenase-like predicted oxidoreductase
MMGDLLARGKIAYWGLSNLNPTQTAETFRACDGLGVPYPVSHQPGYSVFEPGIVETQGKRFTGLDQFFAKYGFGMIAYSPLDAEVLTGKYLKGVPKESRVGRQADNPQWTARLRPEKLAAVAQLAPVAEKAGITLAQFALAWVLGRPGGSAAIMGVTNARQLEENVKAADVVLDARTLDAVEKIRAEYFAATHQLGR